MFDINDIFYSVQGEGHFSGQPAVFIRFSECNLRCSFCDTEFLSGRSMGADEILEAVQQYPTRHIVLTGGEPLMRDLSDLCRLLKEKGYFLQVETNGMFDRGLEHIDWITVSPKNDRTRIRRADELKLLLEKGGEPLFGQGLDAEYKYISPINPGHGGQAGEASSEQFDREAAAYAAEWVMKHPEYRLSIQLHKILGIK